MSEREQTNPETAKRKRSRLGCGVAMLLCLICYVLSYPWVYSAIRRLPASADSTLWSVANVIYVPVDLAIEHNQAVFDFYRWYTEALNDTFPSYFEVPILMPIPSEAMPAQIVPPP